MLQHPEQGKGLGPGLWLWRHHDHDDGRRPAAGQLGAGIHSGRIKNKVIVAVRHVELLQAAGTLLGRYRRPFPQGHATGKDIDALVTAAQQATGIIGTPQHGYRLLQLQQLVDRCRAATHAEHAGLAATADLFQCDIDSQVGNTTARQATCYCHYSGHFSKSLRMKSCLLSFCV